MITAVRLTPSPEENANARKTGSSASRTKPIAFGIVHGFSGWPGSVCGGGGPERSSPDRRRNVSRARSAVSCALATASWPASRGVRRALRVVV